MPRHDTATLRRESDAVRHHCWMLERAHALHAAHMAGTPNDPPGMRQALAGAFVAHARCLHKFFYAGDSPDPRDIIAEDYVSSWRTLRPKKRLSQKEIERINTEIAHLSKGRVAMPLGGIGFDVAAIFAVVHPAVAIFWKHADAALLSDAVTQSRDATFPLGKAVSIEIPPYFFSRSLGASSNVAVPPKLVDSEPVGPLLVTPRWKPPRTGK